jgi:WD40 repeat protein/tetratricopeptide (TPR) repeat protein
MGIVYKARQIDLDRLVALKMILVGRFASSDEVRRFHREARSAARLRHPGIVPIFDFGFHEGRPYLAMDFVDGPSLAARVAAGPLPPREAALVILQLAESIHFAHTRGVIHRDLKPANVLMDGRGHALITDFGLAKRVDADGSLTETGQVMGTPSYMSPEQATGGAADEVGPRSDIYALGATLYCLLTGRPPFQAATAVETLRLVLECEPVAPRKLTPGVHRDLETICLKCLHKLPERRYRSADALARDLERFLAGKPIEARPAGVVEKAARWSGRNRWLAGMSAAVCGLTLLMIAASIHYTITIRSALGDVKQKLVRQYVLNGLNSLEANEPLSALPWFAKALELDEGDSERETLHRIRLASLLSSCPKLVDFRLRDEATLPADSSPDGQRVVKLDGVEARVRDAVTDQPITPPLRHAVAVKSAVFSPDSRRVVTISADHAVRVWDAATGQPLTPPLVHRDAVNDVSFSPDGKALLTAVGGPELGPIGEALLWDLGTCKLAIPPLQHDDDVNVARFSPDGRRVVTGSYDRTARVWDAATGQPVTPALEHPQPVALVVFSPDGTRVATASGEEARIWDAATGLPATSPLRHRGPVRALVFSPCGNRLATEGYDLRVRLWNAATGELFRPAIPEHTAVEVSFDGEGRRLRTNGRDRSAHVWDLALSAPSTLAFPHRHSVTCASYSPDGRRIVTAAADGTWRVWNAVSGAPITPLGKHDGPIEFAGFDPAGRRIVTASRDRTARVWDADTGKPISEPMKHDAFVLNATFSPDGRRLLTTGNDGTARLWEADSGKPLAPPIHHGIMVVQGAFHPDGRRIATASVDGTVIIRDLATGQPLCPPLRHADWVCSLAFSSEGRRLVTTSRDGTARVWDPETGKELTRPLRHEGAVGHAAFSPDGRRIVTASADRTARVWSAIDGAPLTPPLKHADRVNRAIFSPDGLWVVTATGGPDARPGAAQLWDAVTGDSLTPPLPHGEDVNTVAVSPDGRQILTASVDRVARVWPVPFLTRPVDAIVRLSGLLSGERVDDTGGLVPLTTKEMAAAWSRLRAETPEFFDDRPTDRAAWHEHEAQLCEDRRLWKRTADHLTRLIETGAAPWEHHARLANALAHLDDWSRAADAYERAIQLGADDPRIWNFLSLLRLVREDAAGYRKVKDSLVDRFRESDDPYTNNLMSWTCVLDEAPGCAVDFALEKVHRALAAQPRSSAYKHTLGMALYRANRHEEAVRVLNETLALTGRDGDFMLWLTLALPHVRLGHAEEAQRCLDRADRLFGLADPIRSGESSAASPSLIRWQDRVLYRLFRREADRLRASRRGEPGQSRHAPGE